MSIEILPVGVTCNLRCEYCYEEAGRKVTPTAKYHRQEVIEAAKQSNGFWQLFGGEPLLIRLEELEELLKVAYDDWGQSGLQTNGTLITPAHIDLFRKYHTQVGISLDGPDDLNDSRWAGTLEATRRATEKTLRAIDMVCDLAKEPGAWWGHGPTLIITVHAGNCAPAVLPRFKEWIRELDRKGVHFINFHYLEMDHNAGKWFLPDDQLKQAMRELSALERELTQLKFLNFNETRELLRGDDRKAMCVFAACDGWSTSAVQGINNEGDPSNCTRAVKDGIDWLPGEGFGYEAPWQIGDPFPSTRAHIRQLSLYVTPQENGGCKDCRFFITCTGHCPGTGLEFEEGREGDWRLRSTHCEVLKEQFADMEKKLRGVGEEPITLSPLRPVVEKLMMDAWSQGKRLYLHNAVAVAKGEISIERAHQTVGNYHGDHTNALSTHNQEHGDEHGDHVDLNIESREHGDHTDAGIPQYQEHGDHTDSAIVNIPHGDHTDAVS